MAKVKTIRLSLRIAYFCEKHCHSFFSCPQCVGRGGGAAKLTTSIGCEDTTHVESMPAHCRKKSFWRYSLHNGKFEIIRFFYPEAVDTL